MSPNFQNLKMKLQLILTILFSLSFSTTTIFAIFLTKNSSIPSSQSPNNTTNTTWSTFYNLTGCQLGQNVQGLSILKYYFNHFGYIPNDIVSHNFTDDFDDTLESAIKSYQENFNLNITGQLDNPTINHITTPRCGNKDIVNGTTRTSFHVHNVGHYTFFSGTPRWPKRRRNLTYSFHEGNNLPDSVKNIFVRAFERWAEVIPIMFTETVNYIEADIRIGFYNGEHGDHDPFDGPLGTLAHAFSPPSGIVHLDGQENWIVEDDVSEASMSSAMDLESVVVHEIGHLLGLGHSSVQDAIMYPNLALRTKKVELHSDDVEGVQFLYGSNPNFDGYTASTWEGRDTSGACGSGWNFGALVGAGLALLIL